MKNYLMSGDVIPFTASANVKSGDGVLLGSTGLFGVSAGDVASGDEGQAQTKGVFTLPKTSANTPSQFANAYWDASAKEVTTTATDNTLIGVFIESYGNGDTEADVLLVPSIS